MPPFISSPFISHPYPKGSGLLTTAPASPGAPEIHYKAPDFRKGGLLCIDGVVSQQVQASLS